MTEPAGIEAPPAGAHCGTYGPDCPQTGFPHLHSDAEIASQAGLGVTYQGVIAIEWPTPQPGYECAPMHGWKIAVYDALSGTQITTVTRIELHATAADVVAADVTMFADEHGQPVYTGRPRLRDGEAIWGTFPFLVAEMRVRPVPSGRGALNPRFIEPCSA